MDACNCVGAQPRDRTDRSLGRKSENDVARSALDSPRRTSGGSPMRHVILGCLLFLAACGGDLRKETEARPEAVEAAARQAAVTSAAGHALLQKYSALVSEDTLDSCVRAWFGESA